jgi:hypothetical protein
MNQLVVAYSTLGKKTLRDRGKLTKRMDWATYTPSASSKIASFLF